MLDLDETFVHANDKYDPEADIVLKIDVSLVPTQPDFKSIYVKKRPYCDDFLREMAKHFEIVMFTASMERYAQPLFNQLDPKGNLIDYALFR